MDLFILFYFKVISVEMYRESLACATDWQVVKKGHESCHSVLYSIISNWFGSPTSQHILSV